jgi:poly(hydroxyalkanoate) granule-associated protein
MRLEAAEGGIAVAKEEILIVEEPPEESERNPLLEAARKVLLAGIGAMALTQEGIEDFVSRLVERGEIAEQDGKKLVGDVMERRKKDAKKAEEELDKRTDEILTRLNVPSKGDIEELSAQIAALSKKVDELKKA